MLELIFCSYKYDWKKEEAAKNILRTHTTAVSARMLYKLAQKVGLPAQVACSLAILWHLCLFQQQISVLFF